MRNRWATLPILLFAFYATFAHTRQDNRFETSIEIEKSKPEYVATGDEGTITGTVFFEGETPKQKIIDTSNDHFCYESNPHLPADDLVVNDGRLANVLVYVKADAPSLVKFRFPPPSIPSVTEYRGCKISPHVSGIQIGQTWMVLNGDQTNHNINVLAHKNVPFNVSMGPGAPTMSKTFARAELVISVKCNQHSWEKTYLGVFPNPYFSVTGELGHYSIEGLPPGEYTLVTWHEKFGTKEEKIVLGSRESKTVDFRFDASTS